MSESNRDCLDSVNRILVIRFSAMGDIILTTPVLRWIKQRFPDAQLDMLVKTEYKPLVENHPAVDRVLTLSKKVQVSRLISEIRRRHYDAAADLQANLLSRWIIYHCGARKIGLYKPQRRERFWMVYFGWNFYQDIIQPVPLRYLRAVAPWGVLDDGRGTSIYPKKSEILRLENALSGFSADKLAVLAPGAGRQTKRWPTVYFQEVGHYLQSRGYQVVIAGGTEDRPVCECVAQTFQSGIRSLCGDLTFMETAALVQQSKIVVSNDTGVMHMAGAVGTPVVAIFGPTTQHLGFFPFRCNSVVVEHPDLACRPCSFHGTKTCPKKHFRCMKDVTPDKVQNAIEMIIAESCPDSNQ
ncbi:glycosyltransferase family 9 protein [bacterium]|nr:glycosyltransferase family 9 protein [bacterium]